MIIMEEDIEQLHEKCSGYLRNKSDDCDIFMEEDEEHQSPHCNHLQFTERITLEEYNQQAKQYTQSAVSELMQSQQYMAFISTCSLCNKCWFRNECTENCMECGGYKLTRPCPLCDGVCQRMWHRDIAMSHSNQSAYWNGECGLSDDQQRALYLQKFVEPSEENVLDGLCELSTT